MMARPVASPPRYGSSPSEMHKTQSQRPNCFARCRLKDKRYLASTREPPRRRGTVSSTAYRAQYRYQSLNAALARPRVQRRSLPPRPDLRRVKRAMATCLRTKQCCSRITAPKMIRSACRCDRLLKKTGAIQCTACTCVHSPGLHHEENVHRSGRAGSPCLSGMLAAVAHLAPLLDQVVKPCRDISYSNANQVLLGYAASGIFAERLPSQAASLPTTCYMRPH